MSETTGIQRASIKCIDKSEKFRFKKKEFKQYSYVYLARLRILGELLKERAREKWGKFYPYKQLFELREENQDTCIVIGTLYKHQVLKPSVLKEIDENNELVQQPHRSNFVDNQDKLILEDDLQRIQLVGKIDVHQVVTGIVVAVLGYVECDAQFSVKDYIYYESGPQKPLKLMSEDNYVMFLSGFNLCTTINLCDELDLIKYWLYGSFPHLSSEVDPAKVIRVVIAGNSINQPRTKKWYNTKTTDSSEAFSAVQQLDLFLADLSKSIPVDLMPGETDPSNYMLPQQPLHNCMFRESHVHDTCNSVTNPYQFELMNRQILGTSGQNTSDVLRFSNITSDLIALRSTFQWSHIAPTAPDSLPSYPYYEEDPFILTEAPHVYFTGNCNTFETEIYEAESTKAKTRLICIPAFSSTKEAVVMNLKNLDCKSIKFETKNVVGCKEEHVDRYCSSPRSTTEITRQQVEISAPSNMQIEFILTESEVPPLPLPGYLENSRVAQKRRYDDNMDHVPSKVKLTLNEPKRVCVAPLKNIGSTNSGSDQDYTTDSKEGEQVFMRDGDNERKLEVEYDDEDNDRLSRNPEEEYIEEEYLEEEYLEEEYLEEEYLEEEYLLSEDEYIEEEWIEEEYNEEEYLEEETPENHNNEQEYLFDANESVNIPMNRIINPWEFLKIIQDFKHIGENNCSINDLYICDEVRNGLSCKFYISCRTCKNLKGSNAASNTNINEMAAVGSLSTGINFSSFQKICNALDIPCLSEKGFYNQMKQVGKNVLEITENTMKEAVLIEKSIAIEKGNISKDGIPLIRVIIDGVYSKRSYGTNYSALSGAVCIIGAETGKILDAEVDQKHCQTCLASTQREHDCPRNYDGPSSGMETDCVMKLFKRSKSKLGVIYNEFVGDGDSSVFVALTNARIYEDTIIHKIECKHHLMRNYSKHMLRYIEEHKKEIDPATRKIIQNELLNIIKAFHFIINSVHSLDEDYNKEETLKRFLFNAVRHYMGYHMECESLCPKRNTENPICTKSVLTDLYKIIEDKLLRHVDSLLKNQSSNIAEQFHSIVALFVGGKRINYSLAFQYKYRYFGAILHFDGGDFLVEYMKKSMNENPNSLMIKTWEKRESKNSLKKGKRPEIAKKIALKKIKDKKDRMNKNSGYGPNSQQEDMKTDLIVSRKKELYEKLCEDQTKRTEIEKITKDQYKSQLWREKRKNLITASNFGIICKTKKESTYKNKLQKIMYPPLSRAYQESLEYGRKKEDMGILYLENKYRIKIQKVGLMIDESFCYLGATADGITEQGLLIEIKSCYLARNITIDEAVQCKKIKCLVKKNDKYTLKRSHEYFYQIQGQLRIYDRQQCLFLVQTDVDNFDELVERDESFWSNNMEISLEKFWHYMSIEIIDSRFTRSMELRTLEESKELFENEGFLCKDSQRNN